MALARDWFGDGSVYVVDLPLACCALETQTAAGRVTASNRQPEVQLIEHSEVPEKSQLVVTLSGTISKASAPAIKATLDQFRDDAKVVAYGACACAGGPYWDSYAVVPGAADLGVDVDYHIAGCPPPPEALSAVLSEVRDA